MRTFESLSPRFRTLAMSVKSAQDYAGLAAYYNAHTAEHEADAALHEQLAHQYDKTSPQLAGDARHYAAHSKEATEALRNLAKIHDSMAKTAKWPQGLAAWPAVGGDHDIRG